MGRNGGWEERGKQSFKFGEELTGNLGHQENNGPRGRDGDINRAGFCKSWSEQQGMENHREPPCRRACMCRSRLGAPRGPGASAWIPPWPRCAKAPSASREPSRPLLVLLTWRSSIPPLPHPDHLPLSHSHSNHHPEKTSEKPQWFLGTSVTSVWVPLAPLCPAAGAI